LPDGTLLKYAIALHHCIYALLLMTYFGLPAVLMLS